MADLAYKRHAALAVRHEETHGQPRSGAGGCPRAVAGQGELQGDDLEGLVSVLLLGGSAVLPEGENVVQPPEGNGGGLRRACAGHDGTGGNSD